jgi:hypothetical protein
VEGVKDRLSYTSTEEVEQLVDESMEAFRANVGMAFGFGMKVDPVLTDRAVAAYREFNHPNKEVALILNVHGLEHAPAFVEERFGSQSRPKE